MSMALKVFMENFYRGLAIGTHWQDKAEEREYKKQALEVARQRYAEQAAINRARLGIESRKADTYDIIGRSHARLYDASALAKGAAKGGGGISPDAMADYYRAIDEIPPTESPSTSVTVNSGGQQMPAAPAPPPAATGFSGNSEEILAYGGRVRGNRGVMGGFNMTYRPQRGQYPGTPPFNPDPRQRMDPNAPSYPLDAGTSGPGSGMGQVAAPPQALMTMAPTSEDLIGTGQRYGIGGTVGRVAGSVLGTLFGPAGTMVGGAVGGLAGEGIEDLISGKKFGGDDKQGGDSGSAFKRGGRAKRYAEGGRARARTTTPQYNQPYRGLHDVPYGDPTPVVRGNLPTQDVDEDRPPGREVRSPPIKPGERVDAWATSTSVPPPISQWRAPPAPPRFQAGGPVEGDTTIDGNYVFRGGQWTTSAPQNPYHARLLEEDRARRELMQLTKLGQTAERMGTTATGDPIQGEIIPPSRDTSGGLPPNEPRTVPQEPAWARARRQAPSRVDEGYGWTQPTPGAATEQPPVKPDVTEPTPYEPGDTGPLPRDQQLARPSLTGKEKPVYGGASAPRGGGGARRGAIDTGAWKGLRDPTRTEAFSYEKDLLDPYNYHITDRGGATQAYARTRIPVEPATQGASEHAKNNYATPQAQAALYSGHGSATPPQMQQLMMLVDPDGTKPIHENMNAVAKMTHDYFMAHGDKKMADQSAFEVAQFGNTQARHHGAEALKALHGGDQNAALQQLMAGYAWLPDQGTPSFDPQTRTLTMRGRDGTVFATIPIQPGTMENLALGMTSGIFGWDILHAHGNGVPYGTGAGVGAGPAPTGGIATTPPMAGGPAPPPSRPAAQPQAAQAGPSPPPPAAPQVSLKGNEPPPTTQMGPEGPAGIDLTPPLAGQGSSSPPPAAGAAAPPPPTTDVQASAGEQRALPPPQGGGETTRQTQADAEQKHYDKNPFAPPPGAVERATAPDPRKSEAELQARVDQLRAQRDAELRHAYNEALKRGFVGPKGQVPAWVSKSWDVKKKRYDDLIKEAQAEHRVTQAQEHQAERYDIQDETKPRGVSMINETEAASKFQEQSNQMKLDARKNPTEARAYTNSVLSYGSPSDIKKLNAVAIGIWQNNHTAMTLDRAYELAVKATSILRPAPDSTEEPVGYNRQKGQNATQFKPVASTQRQGGVVLQFPDGRTARVDPNTYQGLLDLHQQNWANYQKGLKDEAVRKRRDEALRTSPLEVGKAAINTLAPVMPFVGPAYGAAQGVRELIR